MQVTVPEGTLFYKLYAALLSFVNRELKVMPEQFSDSREYTSLPPETRLKVRDVLYKHRDLIEQFIGENPADLPADELEIVAGWKHAVIGQFFIFRYLSNYTIFLGGSPQKAYGVLALADPFEETLGPYLPRLIHAVLLPLKGKIIYDGLLSGHNITFGGGVKQRLNEEYRQAKETFGIITSLPHDEAVSVQKKPVKQKQPKKAKRTYGGHSTEAKDVLDAVVGLTDAFCKDYLNEEYAEACRKLAGVLARKRPTPLIRGKLETWACGIVRTIGRVNYLDDPSQKPHLKLPLIDKAFGVGQSTGQNKSSEIRKMLKIHQFDHKWILPSRMDDSPLVWMLSVNGFMMDIRDAPREAQEIAFEKGLIPYIPADR